MTILIHPSMTNKPSLVRQLERTTGLLTVVSENGKTAELRPRKSFKQGARNAK